MRDVELLCSIVINHDIKPKDSRIHTEFFNKIAVQWQFLSDYHVMNNVFPNKATFMEQFPTFPFVDTKLDTLWLLDEVKQEYLGHQVQSDIADIMALVAENPLTATLHFDELRSKYAKFHGDAIGESVQFPNVIGSSLDHIEQRRAQGGKITGITTGFPLLDAITQGTQRSEIEIWAARPGEYKSYTLLFGAMAAANAGYDVCYVSPEMDEWETAIRYASLAEHTSASQMVSGKMNDEEWSDMKDALHRLSRTKPSGFFKFHEPQSIGRRFKTGDIARMIELEHPRLVVIDGVLLIDPMKDEKDIRKRVITIMEELKEIAVQSGVPMRLAHQVNRKSEIESQKRTKLQTVEEVLPELHELAESDSVGQYANRVITMKRIGAELYLCVRKNRSNRNGQILAAKIDIDRGIYSEFRFVAGSVETSTLYASKELEAAVADATANINTTLPF
jgi:replicative DNA helicase